MTPYTIILKSYTVILSFPDEMTMDAVRARDARAALSRALRDNESRGRDTGEVVDSLVLAGVHDTLLTDNGAYNRLSDGEQREQDRQAQREH